MTLTQHAVLTGVAAVGLAPLLDGESLALFAAGSILIDVDHYLLYIQRTRRFDIGGMFRYFAELQPIQKTAAADPDLKAARDAVKVAQEKVVQATEAAMIKADPKAKDLLEQRKKLRDELAALQKAEMETKKKETEKKPEKKN